MKKIIIFLVLLGLPLQGYCDTVSDLISKIRLEINDNSSVPTSRRYSDTQLTNWINDAHEDILKRTSYVYTRDYITTIENTYEYSLPSDFIEIHRAYIVDEDSTGTYKRLKYTSVNMLDEEMTEWESGTSGTPVAYYVEHSTTQSVIGLWRNVDASHAGTDYLRIDYIPKGNTLTSGTTLFYQKAYMDSYEDVIILYVQYKTLRNPQFLQLYNTYIEQIKKDLRDISDKDNIIKLRR